jgi:ankyrin repeat protein
MANTFEELNQRLVTAIWEGDLYDVIQVLEDGAYIDFQDENYETPLMIAAQSGNYDMVKELLDRGADRNLYSHDGMTAYDYATTQMISDIISLHPDFISFETGISNLALAAGSDFGTLNAMIDETQNVDQQDREGNTPLMYAVVNEKLDNVRLLLDQGANPNLANIRDETPLDYAINSGQKEIERMLIEAGAVIR